MKKTIFKLLALTLALLMLLPLTMACKKKEEQGGGESNTVATEGYQHPVPPQDLGGKEFLFATSDWKKYTPLNVIDIETEQTTGDFVNDGAHERNLYMKDYFNCTIKQSDFSDTEVTTKLQQNAVAGDSAFDFVLFRGSEYIASVNGGYLANAKDFKLNFENSWWDKNAIDAMTINNKCYGIVGDVTTNHLNAVFMTTFNKKLIENNKLEDPYTLVKENKWTFDKMVQMSRVVAALDSDSPKTKESHWGINYTFDVVSGLLTACGVNVIEKKNDGTLELVYSNYQSDIQDIFTALFDTSHAGDTIGNATIKCQDSDTEIFDKGKVLFMLTATHNAGALRNSNVDYGILPYPKFTETQAYRPSTASNFSMIMGIPLCNMDVDRCSVFLEAYAAQGQERVRSQFYENVLLRKVGRDTESFEMLSYIFENLHYDVGCVYDLAKETRTVMARNLDTDVSSFMTTYRLTWRTALRDLTKAYSDPEPVA